MIKGKKTEQALNYSSKFTSSNYTMVLHINSIGLSVTYHPSDVIQALLFGPRTMDNFGKMYASLNMKTVFHRILV